MEPSDTFIKIKEFVKNALNHRYSRQAAGQTFVLERKLQCSSIISQNGQIKLVPLSTQPFLKVMYRLPQSRIFYTVYQNPEWEISFIEYFKHAIILIWNRNGSGKIRVINRSKCVGINHTGQKFSSDHDVNREVWWFRPKNIHREFKTLLQYLNEVQAHEYRIHPLHHFNPSDNALMARIDILFSELHSITQDGNISLKTIQSSHIIWLHELFLQLGWWDKLLLFYKMIVKKESAFSKNTLIPALAMRFMAILDASGKQIPEWLSTFASKANRGDDGSFLHQFLFPEEKQDLTSLLSKIQNYWEYIQLNALNIKREQEISQHPDEIIAFGLLAVSHQFWWAPQAVDMIKEHLSDENRTLFDLLTGLMLRVSVNFSEKMLLLRSLNPPLAKMELDSAMFTITYNRFGKQIFTNIALPAISLNFRINRQVNIALNLQAREIRVLPLILRPPLNDLNLRLVTVHIGDFKIQIPLIWEQFFIELNRVRLKWLRKKRRFQVVIKNPQPEVPITIDGMKVALRPDRYARVYLEVERLKSQSNLLPFTLSGRRIFGLPPDKSAFTLRGAFVDVFGILKEHCNVHFNDSKKNTAINTNSFLPEEVSAGKRPIQLRCSVKRCDPILLSLEKEEIFWHRLITLPAEMLLNKMKIWLDREKKSLKPEIEALCMDRIGFIPEVTITSIKKFEPLNGTFNFLLSSNAALYDEFIGKIGKIKIFRRTKAPKLKYFLMNLEFLDEYFDIQFFIQHFVKN